MYKQRGSNVENEFSWGSLSIFLIESAVTYVNMIYIFRENLQSNSINSID